MGLVSRGPSGTVVLAWFKKDGRRYQTRINVALRKVMEREMKESG